MADKTICPACGAPLTVSGQDDTVTCGFCGAVVNVTEVVEGEPKFNVVSQPEPQKEVLSKPVEPMTDVPPANEPQNAFDAYVADLEPPQPVNVAPPPPVFNAAQSIPTPPPYSAPAYSSPAQTTTQGSNNKVWIWVAVGVVGVLVLCGACVCLAAILGAMPQMGNF